MWETFKKSLGNSKQWREYVDFLGETTKDFFKRLTDNPVPSIETSSLHLDIINEFKRINSHLCSVAYPLLDSVGALAPSRLKPMPPAPPPEATAQSARPTLPV